MAAFAHAHLQTYWRRISMMRSFTAARSWIATILMVALPAAAWCGCFCNTAQAAVIEENGSSEPPCHHTPSAEERIQSSRLPCHHDHHGREADPATTDALAATKAPASVIVTADVPHVPAMADIPVIAVWDVLRPRPLPRVAPLVSPLRI